LRSLPPELPPASEIPLDYDASPCGQAGFPDRPRGGSAGADSSPVGDGRGTGVLRAAPGRDPIPGRAPAGGSRGVLTTGTRGPDGRARPRRRPFSDARPKGGRGRPCRPDAGKGHAPAARPADEGRGGGSRANLERGGAEQGVPAEANRKVRRGRTRPPMPCATASNASSTNRSIHDASPHDTTRDRRGRAVGSIRPDLPTNHPGLSRTLAGPQVVARIAHRPAPWNDERSWLPLDTAVELAPECEGHVNAQEQRSPSVTLSHPASSCRLPLIRKPLAAPSHKGGRGRRRFRVKASPSSIRRNAGHLAATDCDRLKRLPRRVVGRSRSHGN
jgi:hypothetical protein